MVLAHELGHHVHHDIWKLLVSQSILTLGGLYLVNLALPWAYRDLADRTIVATAKLLECSLATTDRSIQDYYKDIFPL